MTEVFLEMSEYDIRTRTADEARVPLAPLMRPHDLTRDGVIVRENGVVVTCVLVDHPPVLPAFAYQIDLHILGGLRILGWHKMRQYEHLDSRLGSDTSGLSGGPIRASQGFVSPEITIERSGED